MAAYIFMPLAARRKSMRNAFSACSAYVSKQFGSPESVLEFEVKDFPVVVTIDSHGNNLQQLVTDKSREALVAVL